MILYQYTVSVWIGRAYGSTTYGLGLGLIRVGVLCVGHMRFKFGMRCVVEWSGVVVMVMEWLFRDW